MGLLFMPLNVLMLATIERRQVTEASSIANILRSIGTSIGVSACVAFLSQNTQTVRAGLTEYINPYSLPVREMVNHVQLSNAQQALVYINGEIERQAAMSAFVNDFRVIALVTVAVLPLIVMFRAVHRGPSAETPMVVEA
jgi:DHA2 family multidrug resistance protein